MRLVFGLVMILGIGLAGFAVNTARGYFQETEDETRRLLKIVNSIVPTVDVYVVTRKIKYGEQLTKEDVRLIKWPATSLPEGIYTSPPRKAADGKPGVELFPSDTILLRAVLRTMELNEPVLAIKVTIPGKDAGITSRLSKGMRAFAINVNASSGVSGFLRPGDQVDITWTGAPPGGSLISKVIFSGVKLIAIDQSADDDRVDARVARTVTVEVTPQHVAALQLAQSTGKLSLSLVGTGEVSELGQIEIDSKTLLGIETIVQQEEVIAEKCYLMVTKNGEKIQSDIVIPCK